MSESLTFVLACCQIATRWRLRPLPFSCTGIMSLSYRTGFHVSRPAFRSGVSVRLTFAAPSSPHTTSAKRAICIRRRSGNTSSGLVGLGNDPAVV